MIIMDQFYIHHHFIQGSIKRWPITSLHPFGALERELGVINDMDVQTKAILADNNVTDTEFADTVMECLPSIPYTIDADTLSARRNLCDTRMFTLNAMGDDGKIEKKRVNRLVIGILIIDTSSRQCFLYSKTR